MAGDVVGGSLLEVGADSSSFDAAIGRMTKTAERFEATAVESAGKAGDAISGIGTGAEKAAVRYDSATRKFIASVEREVAQLALSREEYRRFEAQTKGIPDAVYTPLIAKLTAAKAAREQETAAAAKAAEQARISAAAVIEEARAQSQLQSNQAAFLAGLREQIALFGKSAEEVQRYRAAQLGIGKEAAPLILQLQNQRAAQEAAAEAAKHEATAQREAAAAKKAAETAAQSFIKSLQDQVAIQGKSQADVLRFRAAQLGVANDAEKYIKAIEQGAAGTGKLGVSAGQTAAALRQLPAQFTDIFTSLQGGQNVLTVFLQQGGQIKDSFGGIGNAIKGLATFITPLRVLIGGVVVTAGALALAFKAAVDESNAFQRSVILTGNAAGLTEQRFNALARTVADSTKTSIGSARETLQALVATGQLSGTVLEKVFRAAQLGSKATGESTEQLAQKFTAALGDVDGFANKLTFLSAEQRKLIKDTADSGDSQKALGIVLDALIPKYQEAADKTSILQRALSTIGRTASDAADAIKGLFRDETPDEQIARLTKFRDLLVKLGIESPGFGKAGVKELDAQIAAIQRTAKAEGEAADESARREASKKALNQLAQTENQNLTAQLQLRKQIEAIDDKERRALAGEQDPRKRDEIRTRAEELRKRVTQGSAALAQDLDQGIAAVEARTTIAAARVSAQLSALQSQFAVGSISQLEFIAKTAEAEVKLLEIEKQRLVVQAQAAGSRGESGIAEARRLSGEIAAKNIEIAQRGVKAYADEAAAILKKAEAVEALLRAEREQINEEITAAKVKEGASEAALGNAIFQHRLALEDLIAAQQLELSLFGATRQERAIAIEQLRIEQRLQQQIRQINATEFQGDADQARRTRQARIDEVTELAAREKAQAAARITVEAFQDAQIQIAETLTDAILDGGRGGVDALKRLFKDLVLRPFIEPIVQGGVNAVAGVLGFGGGTSAQSGSAIQNLTSIGKLLNGFDGNALLNSKAFSQIFNTALGEKLGLSSLTEDAAGNVFRQLTPAANNLATALASVGNAFAGRGVSQLISNGFSVTGGNTLNNIGAIASAIPGVGPIAGVITGTINRLFGRKLEDIGIQGTLGGASGFTGNAFEQFKGGLFRSDKTKTSAIDPALQAALAQGVTAVRAQLGLYADALKLPVDAVADFTQEIKLSLNGLKPEEVQAKIAEALEAFGAGAVKPLADALAPFTRQGEQTADTLQRLAEALSGVNPVLEQLGVAALATSTAGADAASRLADLFGGVQGLASSAGDFFHRFFTEEERAAQATETITTTLAKFGLQVPSTRDAFRDLVQAQDAATESGSKTFHALLSVAGAFDEIVTAAEEADRVLREAVTDALKQFQTPEQQRRTRFENIALDLSKVGVTVSVEELIGVSKDQVLAIAQAFVQAGENSVEARTAVARAAGELARLKDEATEAANALSDRRNSLENDLLRAQGRTQEAVNRERNAELEALRKLDPALASLKATIFAAADAAEEAAKRGRVLAGLDSIAPDFAANPQQLATFRAGRIQQQLAGAGFDVGIDQILGSTKESFAALFQVLGPDGQLALLEAYGSWKALNDELRDSQVNALLKGVAGSFEELESVLNPSKTLVQQFTEATQELETLQQGLDDILGRTAKTVQEKLADMLQTQRNLQSFRTGSLADAIESARLNTLTPQGRIAARRATEASLFAQLQTADDPTAIAQRLMQVITDRVREEAELSTKLYDDQIDALTLLRDLSKEISQFTGSLRFSDLSPLSFKDQLGAAQSLFDKTLAGAKAGDPTAQGNLTANARALLEEAQAYFASGPGYAQIFRSVTASLDAFGLAGANADPQIAALESLKTSIDQGPLYQELTNLNTAVLRRETSMQGLVDKLTVAANAQIDELKKIVVGLQAQLTATADQIRAINQGNAAVTGELRDINTSLQDVALQD